MYLITAALKIKCIKMFRWVLVGEQVLARNHVLHTANADRFWTRDYCTTL